MRERKRLTLGSLCDFVARGKQPHYIEESNLRVVGQRCVRASGFDAAAVRFQDEAQSNGHLLLELGDVLLNSTRTGTIGRTCVFDGQEPSIADSHVTVLRPTRGVSNPVWLREFLAAPETQRAIDLRYVTGSTNQIELMTSRFSRYPVETPAFAEQSAIAEVFDSIDAAIGETKALITKLKLVRIGLVDDLLTRGIGGNGDIRSSSEMAETPLGKRPPDWSVRAVGASLKTAEYGVSTSLGDGPGVPVLRMNNIQDGEFDLADMKFVSANAVSHLRLAPGDVLYNRTNSIEHVGKAAIWRSNEAGPAFASYLVRLVPNEHLDSGFLHIWLNWSPVQRALRRFATPGVQQVNINPTNLKRVVMAAPSDPEEQREIVRRVDRVRLRIECEKHKLLKLSALRNGLRDDLLSGPVRVSTAKMEAVA